MSPLPSGGDILLSVVVPAYNEAATIEAALRQLKQVPLRLEGIAVNDASTGGTGAILDGLAGTGLGPPGLPPEADRGEGGGVKGGSCAGAGDGVGGPEARVG